MTEWVVTLRNGGRHDVDADILAAGGEPGAERVELRLWREKVVVRWWPAEQVTLVQRRDGHLLEQVWPAVPVHEVDAESFMLPTDALVQDVDEMLGPE